MPWAKFDDDYAMNPKTCEAENDTVLFHVFSIIYCAKNLTDGRLTKGQARTIRNQRGLPPGVIDESLRIGFLEETDYGYLVHDYLQYNPTRLQVEAEKEATRKRQEAFRSKREEPSRLDSDEEDIVTNDGDNAACNGSRNAVTNGAPRTPYPVPGPGPEESPLSAESAAPSAASNAPVEMMEEFIARCSSAKKKAGILAEALAFAYHFDPHLYPPNFGRLGRFKTAAGGENELIRVIFRSSLTWKHYGDPYDYLEKAVNTAGAQPINRHLVAPPETPDYSAIPVNPAWEKANQEALDREREERRIQRGRPIQPDELRPPSREERKHEL